MNRAIGLLLIGVFLAACSKKGAETEDLAQAVGGVSPAPPPPSPVEKKEEPPRYVYPYAQKRDPFVPLVGAAAGRIASTEQGDVERGDLSGLRLKGILMDRRGKVALITSSTGEPYTVRSGRVYDRKNRMVGGVTGIIKENSVVLITSNRVVRELSMNPEAGSAVP